jgi:hypothetical protein
MHLWTWLPPLREQFAKGNKSMAEKDGVNSWDTQLALCYR